MPAYSGNRIDPNLTPGNVRDGVSIFGVDGTFTGGGGLPFPGQGPNNQILLHVWSNITGGQSIIMPPYSGLIGTSFVGASGDFYWYHGFVYSGVSPSIVQLVRVVPSTGQVFRYETTGFNTQSSSGTLSSILPSGIKDLGGGNFAFVFNVGRSTPFGCPSQFGQGLRFIYFNTNNNTFNTSNACPVNSADNVPEITLPNIPRIERRIVAGREVDTFTLSGSGFGGANSRFARVMRVYT